MDFASAAYEVSLEGQRIGVLVGVSGLDRVAWAAWLRAAKAHVTITLDVTELVQGLKDGRFDVGVYWNACWPLNWRPRLDGAWDGCRLHWLATLSFLDCGRVI